MEYIGSTAVPLLCVRMGGHRSGYKNSNKCSSRILFDEYGVENCIIELIENYPCADRHELNRREGEIIQGRDCVNKNISGRTLKESHKAYYQANKEKRKKESRDYGNARGEERKAYMVAYRLRKKGNLPK